LKSAREQGYSCNMALGAQTMLLVAALGALGALGCSGTGGLLEINSKNNPPDAGPVLLGPADDLVSAGSVAKSKSYKVVYTLGQSSQDQGVDKSTGHRLNGGLVGAMNGSTPSSADAP
jgi:hypothetical protein